MSLFTTDFDISWMNNILRIPHPTDKDATRVKKIVCCVSKGINSQISTQKKKAFCKFSKYLYTPRVIWDNREETCDQS